MNGDNPFLFLYVLTDTQHVDPVVNRMFSSALGGIDLRRNVAVAVEWGIYPTGGSKVTITDVQQSPYGVNIHVMTKKPNPKEEQLQAMMSALTLATIPRSALPPGPSVRFALVHEGVTVVTQTVRLD
jgi:hypothetical protein